MAITLYSRSLIGVGDFALILGLSLDLGYMTWYLMMRLSDFNQAFGKCKQSLQALIVPLSLSDRPNAITQFHAQGEITFHNVSFGYGPSSTFFQNKSITIPKGQKVGLVGYSGGGKSTFVNLILRLHDVQSGSITIDGMDLRSMTQEALHSQIGVIPQDPSLFHRSLLENIRYGQSLADDDSVFQAAKLAHAHEFIEKLPLQYETLVGERGVKLSGGQRQRVAIARAFLKNAPILILDEATSQLDSLTEHLIQDSLTRLALDKTTLIIAHRLSTLIHLDRILVFENGKIIQDGSHAELLAAEGLYKKLWNSQVNGFLGDGEGELTLLDPDRPEAP